MKVPLMRIREIMRQELLGSLICLCIGVCLCDVCLPATRAQTGGTGIIAGILTDSSGVAVAEATVTATNNATGQFKTATTNHEGSYELSVLLPGTYTVKFSAAGYRTVEITSVIVNSDGRVILNHVLTAGSQTECLTEEWGVPPSQSETSTAESTIQFRFTCSLPMPIFLPIPIRFR